MGRKLKNLANCKPSEFLVQTNKIRKSLENWLTVTDIMEIRKRQPVLHDGMSDDEKRKAFQKQAFENLNAILNSVMDEHPKETLEVLALASFVDPKDVDKYTVSDYLGSFTEIINDENVVSFFISLLSLGQRAGAVQ